jgi:cell surface protein SprA
MAKYLRICICLLTFASIIYHTEVSAGGIILPDPVASARPILSETTIDTIPLIDRYDDYITGDQYNPFDILPENVEQTVEYDLETDTYIIIEKIGDEYYRAPTYMSFNEYMDYRAKKQERDYFDKLSGAGSEYKSGSGRIDPLSKIDLGQNMADRLFGGNDITIEPQGNIDLTIGADYQEVKNPTVSLNQQRQGPFLDFDMDIKMNVEGNIGDKMNLGFNYDTNASFDFDRKIKLAYDSEQFTEDDIIKKIEAGNVSLPLRSTLIQGAQSLFGLKTELQFGHLTLTAIASQQQSEQETVAIQNGSSVQTFEITPDQYDENRHFFISHYHRDVYEDALSNLPYIKNNFRITNIEVWISDDDRNYQENQRTIVAIADIGEPNPNLFTNTNADYGIDSMNQIANNKDIEGRILPENSTNTLYERLINNDQASRSDSISSVLRNQYSLSGDRDFDKFLGRKLSPGEYSFNPELGVVSLNIRLQPEQSLGVSYEYLYTLNCDQIYKVGSTTDEGNISNTDRDGNIQTEGIIYTKMLKSTNQKVGDPLWDLMMKNVYPLRSNSLDPTNFEFDIFYENDGDGSLTKFIPSSIPEIRNTPLLNLFELDNLNERNDPQPDGIFDFVPGVTIIPQNGAIFFPVLEPFGSSLERFLGNAGLEQRAIDSLSFPELYDTTVTIAREQLSKNKFVMIGKYESSVSSEYSLGAWNIPQGSVRVTAGSRTLIEGADYEVDYSIGRVRIINESLLQQGIPINISYEDNSAFSLQQKTMLGLRAEYAVNDNFYVGGTILRLFERPFTQKVNIGDDPINNRIYGLDMAFSTESQWLTKAVDKLPFYSTSTPSNINFNAEVAMLRPGHSGAINVNDEDGGITHLDDFEGAVSGFPLASQANNLWVLASTPPTAGDRTFGEYLQSNRIEYGANRARMSWYVLDQSLIFVNNDPGQNSYTRNVQQDELFMRQIPVGLLGNLQTFDLTYFPDERGPYNYDPPEGTSVSEGARYDDLRDRIILNDPTSRWAGIMRYMPNSDFQAANYEFIEFWLLNPFMEKPDGSGHISDEQGYLTFHLGNVSEDILKDEKQLFENAISVDNSTGADFNSETVWGSIPKLRPNNDAFDINNQVLQDLGLDGINDTLERAKFDSYIQSMGNPIILAEDPAGDNFISFNDFSIENGWGPDEDLLTRYSKFNNPQGNSPTFDNATAEVNPITNVDPNSVNRRGTPNPDAEDLNNNASLQETESFYEYKIPIFNDNGSIQDNEFIRDRRIIERGDAPDEEWYRIRIPISEGTPFNDIQGFRSIQFMRMIINGYETQKTFRMADFELIRSQWRRLPGNCPGVGVDGMDTEFDGSFNVDAVGIEENSNKLPFPYVLPRGIQQERLFNTFSNVLQDERSLSLNYCDLGPRCEVSVYKLTELDLRRYKRLQMFVHAERKDGVQQDGDVAVFLRAGKDFDRHFYEYEIPLTLSENVDETQISDVVWPEANKFDFSLELFTIAKKLRILEGASLTEPFVLDNEILTQLLATYSDKESLDIEPLEDGRFIPEGHRVKILGNPNLGRVKDIQIGLRGNASEEDTPPGGFCGEVWVNELRATGLEERLAVAGLASVDVQLADLGNVTAAGSFSTIGWGALDNRVDERSLEAVKEYDVSASLELGKVLPQGLGLRVPFYAQYSKNIRTPQYDAYDLDITVEDEFDLGAVPDGEITARNETVTEIKTINFTNVRKERSSGRENTRDRSATVSKDRNAKTTSPDLANPAEEDKPKKPRKPMPWDIENFSASYAYTETNYRDPIIQDETTKDYNVGLDYTYSIKGLSIQPFKGVKPKALKIIKEININPLPTSFTFSSNVNRFLSSRLFRIPDTPQYQFDDRRFEWQRRYDLNWNLTKALKLNFSAFNSSYIDELRQVGITDVAENRPYVDEFGKSENANGESYSTIIENNPDFINEYRNENLRGLGRNTAYNHQISVNYSLPLKYIPYMDWIDVKAQYRSDYSWAAAPLVVIDDFGNDIGAVIQNSQNRSITGNFNFDKLYDKSKYLKNLDRTQSSRTRSRRTKEEDTKNNDRVTATERKSSRKKERQPGTAEKLLLRPLFALRSLRINFKEDFRTVIPGITQTPELLGLSSGFNAPGVGFVLGFQPDITLGDRSNYLYTSADKGWITTSTALNQEVLQSKTQSIDAKLKIEPWKDVKIDVDFKKNYSINHQEEFKNKDRNDINFQQVGARDIGSFELTYYTLNTLFGNDIEELFETFEANRQVVSYRLDNDPGRGSHTVDGERYAFGYGKQSSVVLIPAFLAAYTGEDPNSVSLDIEQDVRQTGYIPKPNWNLRYDGLSKLPGFKNIFSSVSIKHAYSSVLRINNFMSDIQYDPNDPFGGTKQNGNYYSRIEIPAVSVREAFNPVIGVSVKTKGDLTLDFEYNKARTLDLSVNVASELNETKKTEFVFGFAYTVKNSSFLKKKKSRTRRARPSDDDEDNNNRRTRGNVSTTRGSDMTFLFDFGFSDDVTLIQDIDIDAAPQPSRGSTNLFFSPSWEYILNQNLKVTAFLDYNKTVPKLLTGNRGITSIQGGLRMGLTLN